MQTEFKIYMRHLLVNGAISQFLLVKIAGIIFVVLMFLMLMSALMIVNLNIPKFVLETQVPYIRDYFSFSSGCFQDLGKVSESKCEREFLP